MVRSIEIPEPVFEVDVTESWDRDEDLDVYHCVVLVGGKFVVFERTVRCPPDTTNEDAVKDEFLAEFTERMKRLLGPTAVS